MTNQLMYTLIQFTWGILQNLVGLVMFLVCKMLGYKSKKYKNAIVTKWNNKYGSVSLGMFLFVTDDEDEELVAHESVSWAVIFVCDWIAVNLLGGVWR